MFQQTNLRNNTSIFIRLFCGYSDSYRQTHTSIEAGILLAITDQQSLLQITVNDEVI